MTDPGSGPWRPEFVEALRLLAQASDAMARRGLPRPVLVGGGAVEFYTASALMTGDIDVTTPAQAEFEAELASLGFARPQGPGHTPLGWIHPGLKLGFEVVADVPFDGATEAARQLLVEPIGSEAQFRILAVEDIIADRMGQYSSGSAPDMLAQAQALLRLHRDVDRVYLDVRIRHETAGEHGIDALDG